MCGDIYITNLQIFHVYNVPQRGYFINFNFYTVDFISKSDYLVERDPRVSTLKLRSRSAL